MKKTFATLLTLLLVFGAVFTLSSCDATAKESEGLEYELSVFGTYYTITGIGECTDKNLVIPAEYNDMPVRDICMLAFTECTSIESVTFGENCNIEEIGAFAFAGCPNLKTVKIMRNQLKTIGLSAFQDCTSLESVEISNNIKNIGVSAFSGCTSLKSVVFENDSKLEVIDTSVFNECTNLTNVVWGENSALETIRDEAFKNCYNLISMEIPESTTHIWSSAFEGCYKLLEIYNRSALDIKRGKDSTFYDYIVESALNIYTDTEGNTKIFTDEGGFIFYEDEEVCYLLGYEGKKTDIILPESLNGREYSIHDYAFYGSNSLTSVQIPSSVTHIGKRAFKECENMETVIFDNTEGWSVSRYSSGKNSKNRTSEELENTSTAATYLNSTFVEYYWTRK